MPPLRPLMAILPQAGIREFLEGKHSFQLQKEREEMVVMPSESHLPRAQMPPGLHGFRPKRIPDIELAGGSKQIISTQIQGMEHSSIFMECLSRRVDQVRFPEPKTGPILSEAYSFPKAER